MPTRLINRREVARGGPADAGPARVLVCGARSAIAAAAIDALHARGHAIVARPDPANRDAAVSFEGVEAVLLCAPPLAAALSAELLAMEAAVRAGVQRIVKVSAPPCAAFHGTPSRLAARHVEVEDALRAASSNGVIIRPNVTVQSLSLLADSIALGVLPLALGSAAVSWVDIRDVGKVVAATLLAPTPPPRLIEVTGARAVGGDEVAQQLSGAVGWRVRYVAASDLEAHERLTAAGLPDAVAREAAIEHRLLRECGGDEVSGAVAVYLGRPPTALRDAVRRDAWLFGTRKR